ncbi:hypothetical protein HOT36_gp25 [Ralstonia phage RPSC1]|uniref:Uncharacterized protein n=1 Tax=Ralstonia phage RPSC1 TaxID=2041351 RepID=A0A2Z2UAQ5_9CAUD|nr:hypothetical protein HOT36_gp25 [Ralstonia phage RPSC1]ATN92955.1 hypothetical protein RPSC1_24 [Ralstonia phage RPSC1]
MIKPAFTLHRRDNGAYIALVADSDPNRPRKALARIDSPDLKDYVVKTAEGNFLVTAGQVLYAMTTSAKFPKLTVEPTKWARTKLFKLRVIAAWQALVSAVKVIAKERF